MTLQKDSLEQAIASFDRSAADQRAQNAEAIRRVILDEFPESVWSTLPLERYAVGQENGADTFCRWMEFKSADLGSISGGAAPKLIIYKHRNKPGWYFPQSFGSVEAAWSRLRSDVVTMLQRAHDGKWEQLPELMPFQYGPALWIKALHLYFPHDVLAVYSRDHLAHYWAQLTGERTRIDRQSAILLNRQLLAKLREIPELQDLSPVTLSYFLYHWADPRQARTILKVAPGENARFWEECLQGGYICVGWDDVGDLKTFESYPQFESAFREGYGRDSAASQATATTKAKELWALFTLEPGDLVVANKGTSEILAVGEVVDPGYEFKADRSEFRHTVRVKWDTSTAGTIEPQKRWAFQTVAPISAALYERVLESFGGTKTGTPIGVPPVDPLFAELGELLEERNQLILYGPPGTGKTYTARRFLLHWLLSKEGEQSANVLADQEHSRKVWSRFSKPNRSAVAQITMLTFHPSYSYEDFVEGFRPKKTDAGLQLELEDGIFKRICAEALRQPGKPFVLFIDEINRANLPKVFGELITVLEADKRGIEVVLPQSKSPLVIPPNVFLIGTMNTADRSIKVLDAAFRRRFAFFEVMPQPSLLAGVRLGDLALDEFLEYLNAKIAKRDGREKQIGHAVFFIGDQPVSDVGEFARRVKHEVIPLLQEYCYEDYGALADYLGNDLVSEGDQRVNVEILQQPEALVAALARLVNVEPANA